MLVLALLGCLPSVAETLMLVAAERLPLSENTPILPVLSPIGKVAEPLWKWFD